MTSWSVCPWINSVRIEAAPQLMIQLSPRNRTADRLICTDGQFHPDAVSTESIDGFVRHFGRWESTIITRMAKMLENSLTVLQRHGRTPLPSVLPLLTQWQVTATIAGRHHFSENCQRNLWCTPSTKVQTNRHPDTPQRFVRHSIFAQKF